ncbi:MAG: hypothetical protein OJJ21_12480 [Ferrovibrio sp.]|uniref:hypothetical protein n=1 Tax=Ferrovibrio sp. TaxID=1917215 RepID=UPI00262B1A89|nr:hypothetical protein [Ferrovibrio sp.]MCW0234407.1 hypothetical protein [Ferrovibrio sp.]
MQTNLQILDWTVDAAAMIAENDDYVVSLYDGVDGDYDVAFIRAKQASRYSAPAADLAAERVAMREARVAFTLAMRQQRS